MVGMIINKNWGELFVMEFENINDSEILLIQGGGKGDIFYDLGWWLASKYKDVGGNTGISGGHF